MRLTRKIGAVVLALFSALMFYDALTVPAFAATAPMILAIALAVAAFFCWPRKRNREVAS